MNGNVQYQRVTFFLSFQWPNSLDVEEHGRSLCLGIGHPGFVQGGLSKKKGGSYTWVCLR